MMRRNLVVLSVLLGGAADLGCKENDGRNSGAGRAAALASSSPSAAGARIPPGVLVAQGLGDVDGLSRTNTLEALTCNYRRGFRWFTVDLALTADSELLCLSDKREQALGLASPIEQSSAADVNAKNPAGSSTIPLFSSLLEESGQLEGVVLVADAKSWTGRMSEAFQRTVEAAKKGSPLPRLVLQTQRPAELDKLTALAKKVNADVILALSRTGLDDAKVEALAREHELLAVSADARRFTPWLEQRLDAANVPLLVQNVNAHKDIVTLTQAGADGFFTDRYVPYTPATQLAFSCGGSEPSAKVLRPWLERDVLRARDYRLRPCVKRQKGRLELAGCDDRAAIYGPFMAVAPGGSIHVELEVEAPETGAALWFEVLDRPNAPPLKAREQLRLKPNERRVMSHDFALALGSPGVETRLGMASERDRVWVHRLTLTQKAPASTVSGSPR